MPKPSSAMEVFKHLEKSNCRECGQRVAEQFESDVSFVIYPLPKVPIMICYWGVEDGMESTLNLLFDKSVDENLPKGSLFTLCVGLALMFEKLSRRHAIA